MQSVQLEMQTMTNGAQKTVSRPLAAQAPLDEHFAALANRLTTLRSAADHKSVGVCSVNHGAGVTTVARNLAAGLANVVDGKVLLVEASTKCSSRKSRGGDRVGWSDVLFGEAEIPDALAATSIAGLYRMPWGRQPLRGPLLCDSRRLASLLATLKEQFEFLIVDLPRAHQATPCYPLASALDGVVLVVEAGRVGAAEATRAKQELEQTGAHLIGAVLNKQRSYIPRLLRFWPFVQ